MMRKINSLVRLLALATVTLAVLGTALAQDRCSTQYDRCLTGYRTQTAGGWGTSCNGGNAACIRDANFESCFPLDLVVGGTYTVRFTSSLALQNYLPDGGTSHVLEHSYTDPTNLPCGQIANQLISLAISLGFSDCGVPGFGDLGSLMVERGVDSPFGPFAGWTVRQVFTLGNTVLGGSLSALPAGISLSELATVLTRINECFVDGTTNTGYLFNPDCWDREDLSDCYRTDGAILQHRMTGVAWLGARVTAETTPRTLNVDTYDDGVTFLHMPWMPCEVETVRVSITDGDNYSAYRNAGGLLYLNAWKDGNMDCDFCDVLCDGLAPEWMIQNVLVTPGTRNYTFVDPGVMSLGHYDGHLRFRLTSVPITDGCNPAASDDVGEVEDYIITDLQLAVEMLGGLNATAGDAAVSLAWTTASETNNDHFEILRDGALVATRPGAGVAAGRTDYRYTDSGLDNGHVYHYSLVAVDANGTRSEVAQAEAAPVSTPIVTIDDYALAQNYPNPFNPTTSIAYALKDAAQVKLTVFDLTGRTVAILVNGTEAAGTHTVAFDGSNLAAGMYFYRIEAGSFTATRKLMLMK